MPDPQDNKDRQTSGCAPSCWRELPDTDFSERFFPCYQPIVGLTSGTVEGYEALARYRDPEGRIKSAGSLFLTPDVDAGLRLQVDRGVRRQALETFAAATSPAYLSINISPGWLDRLDDPSALPTIRMAREAGIDPTRIVIEITETSGDLQRLKQAVRLYHKAGMRVAIDDFGAGASQIDRIEALNPDQIKLDMRLFKQAAQGGISADIALAVTSIASRVGCQIVCEGVETEEEFHFGIECGATHVQGFIFAPAQPALLASDSTVNRVRQLQSSFLTLKSRKLQQAAQRKDSLQGLIMALRAHQLDQQTIPATRAMREAGILRYYICDRAGYQISANHEVDIQGIFTDFKCQGLNWSHRPYFPLFIGLRHNHPSNFFASDIYRDATSHYLCKTYGTWLDEQRLLLVDARVPDEVIYADRTVQTLVP